MHLPLAIIAQVVSSHEMTLLVTVIAITFFIMAVFVIIFVVNIYKQRVKAQEEMLNAIYQTQENERMRIAEDLHDDIGAMLSALKLRIDGIQEDSMEDFTQKMAKDSNALLDQIINDIREIVRNLASKHIINNTFKNELIRFQDQFNGNEKIKIAVNIGDGLPPLENNLGINLFRIIQEIVNNSVKHSGGSLITIDLKKSESGLEMKVADNGKGFDPDEVRTKGMGLANIDARVKLFKGRYELSSVANQETSYKFVFPTPPDHETATLK